MPFPHDGRDSWRIFRIMAEFVEGFEVMSNVGPAVSIFGSARTAPSDPYYRAAEKTAALLVKAGFAVITGGGPGIMEAANKGALEAGGTSVGLNISLPQEQEANRYQNISLDFHYFYARKVMFTKYASAFIYFPGGYGTFDELFETLTLVQTLKVEAFPIVLYGEDYWRGLVHWMDHTLKPDFIDPEDMKIFRVADNEKKAVRLIKEGVDKRWWSPVDRDIRQVVNGARLQRRKPLEGAESADTGEGTLYGQRPRHSNKAHASGRKPKPQQ